MLLEHLQQAERHVAQGEDHVVRQRRIVAELERDGHDTRTAMALLSQFEEMQALHIENLKLIRAELASAAT